MKHLSIILLLLGASSLLCAQPTLNMAVVGTGPIRAGNTIQISVALSGVTGFNVAALQQSVYSSVGGTFTVVNGPVNTATGKTSTCAAVAGGYTCIDVGMNTSAYFDGVVKTLSLVIPANATPGQASISMNGLIAADASGNAVALRSNLLSFTLASPISQCDVNGDGTIDAFDLTAVKNQVLGLAACSVDLDGDGKCTAVDAIRVVIAASGGACKVGQ